MFVFDSGGVGSAEGRTEQKNNEPLLLLLILSGVTGVVGKVFATPCPAAAGVRCCASPFSPLLPSA